MANSIQHTILHAVEADARERLRSGMDKGDRKRVEQSLRTIVEANLPDPLMPKKRIDLVYRRHGNPHVAWKWVTRTGTIALVAEVDHRQFVVTATLTYPGLSKRPNALYRDESDNPDNLPLMVQQAVRQIQSYGLL